MFHFKRKTLWVIIYITIPLIAVLHSLDSVTDSDQLATKLQWSRQEISHKCDEQWCYLILPGAQAFALSLVYSVEPIGHVPNPHSFQLVDDYRNDYYIMSLYGKLNEVDFEEMYRFIRDYAPKDEWHGLVITAPDEESVRLEPLLESIETAKGAYRTFEPQPRSRVTQLASPPFGSDAQLAFLIWMDILINRLSGYSIQIQWDHRAEISYVLFNTTLFEALLSPASQQEWRQSKAGYVEQANNSHRTVQQWHQYGLVSFLYGLPFDHFVDQVRRLRAVTYQEGDEVRLNILEQVQGQAKN